MARDFQMRLGVDLTTFNAGLQRGLATLRERAQIAFNQFRDAANVALSNAQQLAGGLQAVTNELQEITQATQQFFAEASAAAAGDEISDFRLGAVFGDATEEVAAFTEELSAGTDRAVGDLRTMLAEFGAFTNQLGFTREESAKLSKQISETVLSFADLQNIGDSEAFSVIQQALAGQTRALKAYGISIDETDEKLKALELGLDPQNLTNQEAATVRLALVMERLGVAAGATEERQKTFTGSLRALQNQIGELFGDIGAFVNDALQPLIVRTTEVVKEVRQWIADNPRLAQTFIVVAAAIGGFLVILTGIVGAAAGIIGALSGVNTAIIAMGGTAQIGAAATTVLTGALTFLKAAAAASVPILAAVGAAIVGWQIGRAADSMLGLNDSFERVRKGTASWVDHLKSAAMPVLKAVADAAAFVGERLEGMQQESLKKLETQNLEKLVATFAQGSRELQTYNRLLREGVPAYQAAIVAANELNEIRFLEQKGAAASATELQRLSELRARNTQTLHEEVAAQTEAKSSAEQLAAARDRLKATEQQFAELIKSLTLETIKNRRGETAATIAEMRTQLQERRKFLQQRAADELALVRQLEEQKKTLQASAQQDGKNSAAQRAIESQLNTHAANLQRIRDTMLAAEESFNANVQRVLQQRAEVMRQEADKRIGEIQRESEAVQREYQSQLDAITAQIERIKGVRQSGQDDAARLIKSLEDASTRERNAVLANVQAEEEKIAATLRGNATDAQRAKLQEVGIARLRSLADMTAQLAEEERRRDLAFAATAALSPEDRFGSESSREIGRIEKRIEELQNLKAEVDSFVAGSADRLAAAATEGATATAETERELEFLEQQRLSAQESINEARREEVRIVQRLNEELKRQLELQRSGSNTRADGLMSVAETEAAAGLATSAKSEAAAPAAALATTEAAANQALAQNTGANTALGAALATTSEVLSGLAAAGAQLLQHGQILPQISTTLSALRDDQLKFGELLDTFGTVVIQKFTETQTAINTHSNKLAEHTQALKNLQIAGGVVDARTAGY